MMTLFFLLVTPSLARRGSDYILLLTHLVEILLLGIES